MFFPAREPPLSHLARALDGVVQLNDPYARRAAYHRAVLVRPAAADDNRAAAIAETRRRALHHTPSLSAVMPQLVRPQADAASDDLVARMAVSLADAADRDAVDLGDGITVDAHLHAAGFPTQALARAALVDGAVERARLLLQRHGTAGGLLDRAADAAAIGSLILAWACGYCLLCPPAHAAGTGPLVTDERLASLAPWAPIIITVLLLLACLWVDLGRPWIPNDATSDPDGRLDQSPPTAPDLASLDRLPRAGGQG